MLRKKLIILCATSGILLLSMGYVVNTPSFLGAEVVFADTGDLEVVDGISYRLNDSDMTATVMVIDDSLVDKVVIPETVNGYTVTSLGDGEHAFSGRNLTELVLPNTLTSVGKYSLTSCHNLVRIEFPESVTSLPEYCFISLGKLEEVVLGKSIVNIPDSCFTFCTGLKTVMINGVVESVGNYAFQGCRSLTAIDLGDSVVSLGYQCFAESGLTEINLPSTLTTIGNYCFRDTKLVSIEIPDSVTSACNYWFLNCNTLKYVVIGDSVPSVNNACFSKSLETLVLGDSITSLDENLFYRFTNLRSITFGSNLESIGISCFVGCTSLEEVVLPESLIDSSSGTFMSYTGLKSIGSSCFAGCISLEEIVLPESLLDLAPGTFLNCTSLKSVEFGSNLKSIGDTCFRGCTSLEGVVLPEGVSVLSNALFDSCANLNSVVFKGAIKEVSNSAFGNCPNLEYIKFEDSVETINKGAFYNGGNMLIEGIPDSITLFDYTALQNVKGAILDVSSNFTTRFSNSGYHDVSFLDSDGSLIHHYYVSNNNSVERVLPSDEEWVVVGDSKSTITSIVDDVSFMLVEKQVVDTPILSSNKDTATNRDNTVEVSIDNPQLDVDYYYTLDGSEPSVDNGVKVVNNTVSVPAPDTNEEEEVIVSVRGIKAGYTDSDTGSLSITFRGIVSEPVTPPIEDESGDTDADEEPPTVEEPSDTDDEEPPVVTVPGDKPVEETPPTNNPTDTVPTKKKHKVTKTITEVFTTSGSTTKNSSGHVDKELITTYSWDYKEDNISGTLVIDKDNTRYEVTKEDDKFEWGTHVVLHIKEDKPLKLYSYVEDIGKYVLLSEEVKTSLSTISFETTAQQKYVLTENEIDAKDVVNYWVDLGLNEWVFYPKYSDERITGWHTAGAGEWLHNGVDTEGDRFHLGDDGIMKYGWFEDNDGKWYYLDNLDDSKIYGGALRGWWYLDNKWYHFDEQDSHMSTGWFVDTDGKGYQLDNK